MKQLIDIIKKIDHPKILDIGTGSGQFVRLLTEACNHYNSILGVDTYEKAVKQAEKSFKDERITFKVEDIYNISDQYDIVCLSNSLHHFDEPEKILEKMMSLTKEDGYLIFNEMIKDDQNDKQMIHVEMHHFWAMIDRLSGVSHNETFTKQEVLDYLKLSNTKVINAWAFESEEYEISDADYVMLRKSIPNALKRVKKHNSYGLLTKTGDVLLKRLDEVGFELATEFMVVLKKC